MTCFKNLLKLTLFLLQLSQQTAPPIVADSLAQMVAQAVLPLVILVATPLAIMDPITHTILATKSVKQRVIQSIDAETDMIMRNHRHSLLKLFKIVVLSLMVSPVSIGILIQVPPLT